MKGTWKGASGGGGVSTHKALGSKDRSSTSLSGVSGPNRACGHVKDGMLPGESV